MFCSVLKDTCLKTFFNGKYYDGTKELSNQQYLIIERIICDPMSTSLIFVILMTCK
jgi:hypothetical protein